MPLKSTPLRCLFLLFAALTSLTSCEEDLAQVNETGTLEPLIPCQVIHSFGCCTAVNSTKYEVLKAPIVVEGSGNGFFEISSPIYDLSTATIDFEYRHQNCVPDPSLNVQFQENVWSFTIPEESFECMLSYNPAEFEFTIW